MKLKISKALPPKKGKVDNDCIACAGSGYYDWMDPITKEIPKCEACDGTGLRNR